MMIFFLVKQRDLRVTLRQHCQGRRLDTAHIQGAVIEDGEKAGSIDPHQPIRFLAAEGRLIQGCHNQRRGAGQKSPPG